MAYNQVNQVRLIIVKSLVSTQHMEGFISHRSVVSGKIKSGLGKKKIMKERVVGSSPKSEACEHHWSLPEAFAITVTHTA